MVSMGKTVFAKLFGFWYSKRRRGQSMFGRVIPEFLSRICSTNKEISNISIYLGQRLRLHL
ncbi:hypothetical protein RHMOL_Rhmol13G0284200 [Rhododendron molle]|uniref:Uncharacterized protein n=1 Tax=Rhododendron molle TaxID=49168 RepID=A0ACC0LDA5_RHOML|nr:hypothetical protein RHMOL_Rhmol13G0284200 [Rhododendron molle]